MKSFLPEGTGLYRRYRVGRVLGTGGFGVTYAAYDLAEKEWIALKEYFPDEWGVRGADGRQITPIDPEKSRYYRHGMERFIKEASILAEFKNIRGIVNVRDVFAENGTAYMAMDFLDGYTVSGYMRCVGRKTLPYQTADRIIKEAGLALGQVHRYRYLHRDVSPDNIMLTRDGNVCLIDFGATRAYALNSAKSMSVLVKPGFAPIEQYSRSGKQGPWTDVYALAATYYFIVTGTKPPGAPERIAGAGLVPLERRVPGIPGHISRAVGHALAENGMDRPQNVRDFLGEMGLLRRPYVLLQAGNKSASYYFMPNDTLSIGRDAKKSNLVLGDGQVSAVHCRIWYEAGNGRFLIENDSVNYTYTSRGILKKGQRVYLARGDWFYIQTAYMRYIFYPEVK